MNTQIYGGIKFSKAVILTDFEVDEILKVCCAYQQILLHAFRRVHHDQKYCYQYLLLHKWPALRIFLLRQRCLFVR